MNILIIDDDAQFNKQLSKGLLNRSLQVDSAHNLTQANKLISEKSYHYIILDIDLGIENGFEIFNSLDQLCSKPKVIVLTGVSKKEYAIEACNNHAHHYLEKPIRIKELLKMLEDTRLNCYKLNSDFNSVITNDKEIPLTAIEFKILEFFIHNHGKVISKEDIHQSVYNQEVKVANTINTHLLNLKNKIPLLKKQLRNIRGKGYLLNVDQ